MNIMNRSFGVRSVRRTLVTSSYCQLTPDRCHVFFKIFAQDIGRAFLNEPVSRVPVHVMRVVQFVQTLWSSHICTIYWIAFKISQELKSATRFTRSFPTTRAAVQSQLSGQTSFKEPGYFCPSLVRHGQRSEPIACANLYYLQIS